MSKLTKTDANRANCRRYRSTIWGRAVILVKDARNRARREGVAFALDVDDVAWSITRGQCAATGIEFDLSVQSKSRANPFAPSLDRMVKRKGYVPSNVRVVVWIFNMMRCDFGDAAVARFKRQWRHR